MRVLWFTNTMLPGHVGSSSDSLRASGGWMNALLEEVVDRTDWQIAVATAASGRHAETRCVEGVEYFVVPCPAIAGKLACERSLERCAEIVNQWRPDLVHIHGTERFYGLLSARKMIETPTVISLQGLLGPYSQWYHCFGNRTLRDIVRMHRWLEIPAMRGQFLAFWRLRKRAIRENAIIRGNKFFMGRTLWDRAHVMDVNPQATYYSVGELLRQPFWGARWKLEKCRRHRVIFTNACHPRKGPDVLLDAIPPLRRDYPDIQVCLAGSISNRSGYGRYIRRKIRNLGGNVVELGALNAEEMTTELVRSHAFVSASFIENSPNALCEAQLVGLPVISSYTGGVPSLIEDGKTGLFFPNGDTPTLAARLREVFENDDLSERLGSQARDAARRRHAPDNVVAALIRAYKSVLEFN
ncbi:MAG: glycosyltransferase family 4 protein [Planctomycetota bacterium]